MTKRLVPESHGQQARLDLGGTALVGAGLLAVVLPLVEGQQHGWPAWTWLSLAVSPLLLGCFVRQQQRRQRTSRSPLVDLSLFANRGFSVVTLAALTFGLVPPSFFFMLAIYLQQGRGFTALFSGEVFAAVGVGFFAAMLTSSTMTARLGRQILAIGALVVAVGCVLTAVAAGGRSSLSLTPGLAVVGFGLGMVLVPMSATVMADVAPVHASSAAGMLSAAQQIGAAIGVAGIGTLFYQLVRTSSVVHAFATCLWVLAGLTLVTAILVQLLPTRTYGTASSENVGDN